MIRQRGERGGRRWPYQPLAETVRLDDELIADHLGVSRNAPAKWRQRGLSDWQADKICCQLGVNAENVWDGYLDTPDRLETLFDSIIWPPPRPPRNPTRLSARDLRLEQHCWRQLRNQLHP